MAVRRGWADIPFERVSKTTYPMRRHIPQRKLEQAMAQRNARVRLKPGKSRAALTITRPNAAGVDIGSAAHFVAVPPDRDDDPVREFPSFTVDLNALADWLQACAVETVVVESTGVYWIPLFELLESRGFTVLLVNARLVKNVSGRKSDVLDCQWLQQLPKRLWGSLPTVEAGKADWLTSLTAVHAAPVMTNPGDMLELISPFDQPFLAPPNVLELTIRPPAHLRRFFGWSNDVHSPLRDQLRGARRCRALSFEACGMSSIGCEEHVGRLPVNCSRLTEMCDHLRMPRQLSACTPPTQTRRVHP
jgi:hypothetical protein